MIFDPHTEKEKINKHPAADPARLNPYTRPALCGVSESRILMVRPANKKGKQSKT
jgi:hypothetical protein